MEHVYAVTRRNGGWFSFLIQLWIRIKLLFASGGGQSSWHGRGASFEEACRKAKQKSGKPDDSWFKVEEQRVKVRNPITEYYVLLSDSSEPPS